MQPHNTPDIERDPVTGEPVGEGYTPPNDAPIPLATPKPKVKTVDKRKVGILAAVLGGAVAVAFVVAFSPKPKQSKEAEEKPAEPVSASNRAEVLNALPGDYSDAAKRRAQEVPQLGPPMPGEIGQMQLEAQRAAAAQAGQPMPAGAPAYNNPQYTAQQQFYAQQELERLKRAADARSASPGFGRGGSAGGAGTGGALTAGAPLSPDELLRQNLFAQAGGAPAATGLDNKAARDDANRQDDKRDFLRNERADSHVLAQGVQGPATPTVISAGTIIPALFLTGINSDLPGQITAQVSQPVYDTPTGRHVVIPQGSVLIGTYDSRVTFGQNRVLLVWQRLRFPNGASLNLEGMPGVDMSGYAGVRDKVNNHWGKLITSVVLSSTLSAAVAVAEGDSFSSFERDAGQAASQGAAQAINQAGGQIVQRSLQIQPTLEIRPGQRVAVMVNKDLALPPYVE